jgi:mycoredoxin
MSTSAADRIGTSRLPLREWATPPDGSTSIMSQIITRDAFTPPAGAVTMFTTTWCGYCRRLKNQMDKAGVTYTEVDIEHTPGTAELVAEVNGGNQTVPTLVFPDGTTATNPSLAEVQSRI